MEACEVCGFEWDAIRSQEVTPRLRAAAAGYAAVLQSDEPGLGARPDPATWSVVEYTAHARDVLFNLRDRIVTGLAEDHPTPKGLYTDVRVANGLYAADTPSRQIIEMGVATDLFVRTFEAMTPEQLARTLVYPWPRVTNRTLLWVAAQALHEVEHHLGDIQRVAGSTSA